MKPGWLKLHRKILDWEWYNDPNTSRLFLHLLLSANFEAKKWQGKVINPGQLLTGREKLAQETGLTVRQIRTSLKRLETTGEIARKTTSKYSLITICKWEYYQTEQAFDRPANRPAERPTNDQQTTTIKEGKEIKEEKNNTVPQFERFWSTYGKDTGRVKCLEKWRSLSEAEIEKILIHVPRYVESKPDVQFRKNPLNYLNDSCWNDQIIMSETKSVLNQSAKTIDGKPKLAI